MFNLLETFLCAHTARKKRKINTAASIIHTFSNNLLKSSKCSLYAHYHWTELDVKLKRIFEGICGGGLVMVRIVPVWVCVAQWADDRRSERLSVHLLWGLPDCSCHTAATLSGFMADNSTYIALSWRWCRLCLFHCDCMYMIHLQKNFGVYLTDNFL